MSGHDLELIAHQIALEYQIDSDGDLVPFPGSSEQARFVIYRYTGGYARYYRHDLPPHVRQQLTALPPARAYAEREAIAHILGQDAGSDGPFVSCTFASMPDRHEFPLVCLQDGCHVVLADGEPVAWAWSSRENDAAAELAVETAPDFRRRGYGRQVAAAWAHDVMQRGKVASHSYAETNVASQALARSLGVVVFARVIAYT